MPINTGELDRRISIERNTPVRDNYGQPIGVWTRIGKVRWARYRPITGDERFGGDQFIASEQVEFLVRWAEDLSTLNPKDRVVYPAVTGTPEQQTIYDIMAVHEMGQTGRVEDYDGEAVRAMTMLTDMVAVITTTPTVTALVSTRMYPDPLPQNATLPALTYSQASAVRVRTLRGVGGKSRHRISISCWGSTYASSKAVADALRRAIDGSASAWWQDTFIGSVALENELDLHEEGAGLVSVGEARVVQDYIISHLET